MDACPRTTSQLFNQLQISADFVKSSLPSAEISIVLGSGLSEFYKRLENPTTIPYSAIPYMPMSTVKFHVSTLYHGYVEGTPVYCWGGRLHGYEGYSNSQISYLAHLSAFLGCHTLLVTNASGSSIKGSRAGDIILVKDHINHFGSNPLDTNLHTTFLPLHSELGYDHELIQFAKGLLDEDSPIKCHEGTYYWVRGPCFETGYEIESYTKFGGDLYGMSTVPEVLAAQAHGVRILVTAVIANLAAGLCDEALTHELVGSNIARVQKDIENYFVKIIKNLPPYKGKIQCEWTEQVVQKSLVRGRVEYAENVVSSAVEWLRAVEVGQRDIGRLIFANCSRVDKLGNLRRFLVSDMPGIVLASAAGNRAEVVIGEFEGQRIAVVLTKDLEGLSIYEAHFVLRVFEKLGVKCMHYVFPAFTDGGYHGVADYFGFRMHGRVCWPLVEPTAITPSGEGYVQAFAGPTFPSPSERKMSEKLGFVASIANMSVLGCASCMGLAYSASYYGASELKSLTSAELSMILTISYPNSPRTPIPDTRGVLYTPSSPEQLESLAASLLTFNQRLAFVSTQFKISQHFNVIKSLSFDKLPYQLHFTSEGVLLIEGSPVLLHEGNYTEMMLPYFLANLMNIKKFVVLDKYSPVLPTSKWLRVTKHCGVAFYNPLFGRNNDKWGLRFPDMSLCYAFNPNWHQQLLEKGIDSEDGGVAFTAPERPLVSQSFLRIAKFIEAKGVVQDGVYAAIVAQHRLESDPPRELVYYAAPSTPTDTELVTFTQLVKELLLADN